ncbi:hypothetical protein [Litorimonas sp. WD9-15]|uniref:hypothetical protein n=1 Tax=Litorimonas sp. WD9-15 TaxID=3418716 RepID=UPI003D08234A
MTIYKKTKIITTTSLLAIFTASYAPVIWAQSPTSPAGSITIEKGDNTSTPAPATTAIVLDNVKNITDEGVSKLSNDLQTYTDCKRQANLLSEPETREIALLDCAIEAESRNGDVLKRINGGLKMGYQQLYQEAKIYADAADAFDGKIETANNMIKKLERDQVKKLAYLKTYAESFPVDPGPRDYLELKRERYAYMRALADLDDSKYARDDAAAKKTNLQSESQLVDTLGVAFESVSLDLEMAVENSDRRVKRLSQQGEMNLPTSDWDLQDIIDVLNQGGELSKRKSEPLPSATKIKAAKQSPLHDLLSQLDTASDQDNLDWLKSLTQGEEIDSVARQSDGSTTGGQEETLND